MDVYLFRHGQKGSTPYADPDLTEAGFAQSRKLADGIRDHRFLEGTEFVASPRLRAQSTLRAAALLCRKTVHIEASLDQRESYESAHEFKARISEFIQTLPKLFKPEDVIYLCTHHDWVEEALALIPADTDLLDAKYWTWHPAQYAQFKINNGLWELQSFDKIPIV